jgi:dihydrofolate reductase
MISLIVAYDRRRGIGKNNALPWRLPAEMAYFKRTTMGKPIVMGRRTLESIGRALPGRRNIVVTSRPVTIEGVERVASLDEALRACPGVPEVMVIGGAELYAAALPHAGRVYATEVDAVVDADTFFPALDPDEWHEVARDHRPANDTNPYALSFVVLEKGLTSS